MTEERKRVWDVWFGVLGPIITVAGILVGVWQFNTGERNRVELANRLLREKDTIEFKRKLWLDRVTTYRSIAELAGGIAASEKKDKDFLALVQKFRASYWGLMILVEDLEVRKQMVNFWADIHNFEEGWTDANTLKVRAQQLGEACRASIERGSVL
ncbi:MAG: hypothetical protein J0H49_28870 [Acidobacteria bacterium]|nr:hypothetical protein [Acidobacteriota bacterium]